MERRNFLRALSAITGSSCVAGRADASATSAVSASTSLRLGYIGRPCEAATFGAPADPAFRHARLKLQLERFTDENALIAALGAGRVDAASVTLPGLLQPLARGVDARVVAGLHAGCLRVVAPDVIEINALTDLRGKALATDRFHGASMNLLSALLFKSGIDPRRDVSWHVYSEPDLAAALDAKTVACVATADPLGYLLVRAKKAEPYLDAADGGFSCGGDLAHSHQCFLVLNGGLVRSRPRVAAAVTGAYLSASARLAAGIGPAAVTEVRGNYVDADLSSAIAMLSSYDWSATTELVLEEIELTARDFKRAGLLGRETDPQQLAEQAFADVLHA